MPKALISFDLYADMNLYRMITFIGMPSGYINHAKFPVHRFAMSILAEELIKRKHNVTWAECGFSRKYRKSPKRSRRNLLEDKIAKLGNK
ncbi:hypothetical protein X798_01759 [Onchocerca flexuosa]|uniref:Uncharacterized protein n=1 Tax=Onchocerca flexuosa TaxID=387005 RepID=A0A238C1K6_9BILA|nr:hypothetical protein X798_01759 [Onchocerca flexuosa]